jgi:hypothetical protein
MNFSLLHVVQTDSGAYPSSYTTCTEGAFLGGRVKRPGREADNSPPTSAEVKKTGIYIYIDIHEFIYTYSLPHTSSWRSA